MKGKAVYSLIFNRML